MREKSATNQPTFALTADVSEAHRQVPVHRSDWQFLGCRVQEHGPENFTTVGTLGASHYWSRGSGAIGRLAQYLSGHTSATWHMLVADDFHLEAGGPDYKFALTSFFVSCAVAGVRLSWPKAAGGDTVIWSGLAGV